MVSPHGSAFSRRTEGHGTIVSTCNTCFVAVAISQQGAELEKAEREHACNPETLHLWKMLIREIKCSDRSKHQGQSI